MTPPNPSSPDLSQFPFTIRALNPSTHLIREKDDKYGEYPHIYAKIVFHTRGSTRPALIVLSDTGCGTHKPLDSAISSDGGVILSDDGTWLTHRPRDKRDGLVLSDDGMLLVSRRPPREEQQQQQQDCSLGKFLRQTINPDGKLPYLVITTHCHYDHILGLKSLPSTKLGMTTVLSSSHKRSFIMPRAHLADHSLCDAIGVEVPEYEVGIWAGDGQDVKVTKYYSPYNFRKSSGAKDSDAADEWNMDEPTGMKWFPLPKWHEDQVEERVAKSRSECGDGMNRSTPQHVSSSSSSGKAVATPRDAQAATQWLDEYAARILNGTQRQWGKGWMPKDPNFPQMRKLRNEVTQGLRSSNGIPHPELDTGLTVLHTPGHTPDSLTWYDRHERYICVGDSFYERESADSMKAGEPPMPTIFDIESDMLDWWESIKKVLAFVRERNEEVEEVAESKEGGVVVNQLVEESEEEQEDAWIVISQPQAPTPTKKTRIRLGAAHVTAEVDAEECLLEMQDFMRKVLRGEIPSCSVGRQRGEETCLWDEALGDGDGKGRFSVKAPLRIIEEGRAGIPVHEFRNKAHQGDRNW